MTSKPDSIPDPGTDPELIAYADGALEPARAALVEARLADDPDARAAVDAWRHHAALIREIAATADALPANLQTAALERQLQRRLRGRQLRGLVSAPMLRNAAAAILVFAAGWGAGGLADRPAPAPAYPGYVERAVGGHLIQAGAEIEVARYAAADVEQALQLMREDFQHDFRLAQFDLPGYRIESVYYARYASGPFALFTYKDAQGKQTRVAVERHPPQQPDYDLVMAESSFGNLAYWNDGPIDYAVVAAADTTQIEAMVASIRSGHVNEASLR